MDAEDFDRDKWVVSAEGSKGLDWVLEVHVGGDRKKDAERNVERYARLGIPEYFLYDRARNRLSAYRLISPEVKVYNPILPNHGLYESRVLGLDVQVDEDRLRFYAGTALLLESSELIERVQAMYDAAQRRADEEAQRREEAEQRHARRSGDRALARGARATEALSRRVRERIRNAARAGASPIALPGVRQRSL